MAQILIDKEFEKKLTELISALDNAARTFVVKLDVSSGLDAFKESLGGAAKQMGVNLAASLALTAATEGLSWVYTNVIMRSETAIKKSNELASEYESQKASLDSLNSELETTQKRIKELETLNRPLSLVEQGELDNLKEKNKLLERQIRYNEIILDQKMKDMVTGAVNAINEQSDYEIVTTGYDGKSGDKREVTLYDKLQREKNNLEKAKSDLYEAYNSGDETLIKSVENRYNSTKQNLAELQQTANDEIGKIIPGVSAEGDKLLAEYTPILAEVDIALANSPEDISNDLIGLVNNAGKKINNFDSESSIINNLIDSGTQFKTDSESVDKFKTIFPAISKAVEGTSFNLREYLQHLNNVAAAQDNAVESGKNLSEIFDSISNKQGIYDSVKDELKSYGRISTQTLQRIQNSFPDMENAVVDYSTGTISATQFFELLKTKYQKDVADYKLALADKQGDDEKFWHNTINQNKAAFDEIKEKYGIDLTICKNWNEAKAAANNVFAIAAAKSTADMETTLSKIYGSDSATFKAFQLAKGQSAEAAAKFAANAWAKYLSTDVDERGNLGQRADNTVRYYREYKGGMLKNADPSKLTEQELWLKTEAENILAAQAFQRQNFKAQAGLEEILGEIFDNVIGGYSSTSGNSSYGSSSVELPKAYENALKELKHQRSMEYINEEAYYTRLEALRKQYLEGVKAYADENRSLLEDIHSGQQDLFDTEISNRKQWISDRNLFQDWAPDENPVKEYQRLIEKLNKKLVDGLISREYHTKKLAELQRELYQAQLDQYNAEKDAMQSVIDMTVDMIKQENQDMIDALEKQKDIYAEIIDKKKESLELSERELDYQRGIEDKTADIAKLQAQYDALAFDDSRAGQAKRAALAEQIAEKQRDLDDYQHDHAVDNTQDMLDKQLEGYEYAVDEQIKYLEDSVNNQRDLIKRALDMIETDSGGLYEKLITYNDRYGTGLRQDVINPWNTAIDAVKRYKTEVANATAGDFYDHIMSVTDTDYNQRGQNTYNSNSPTSTTDTSAAKDANGRPNEAEIKSFADKVKSEMEKNGSSRLWIVDKSSKSPSGVKDGDFVMTGGGVFMKGRNGWKIPLPTSSGTIKMGADGSGYDILKYIYDSIKDRVNGYATGGIADYTGFAKLHGSQSKVETIFNAEQGKKLFDLIDGSSSMQLIERMYNNLVLRPMAKMPQVTSSFGGISVTVEAPVTVNGSADADVLTQLGTFGDKLADNVTVKITDAFSMRGKGIGSSLNALKRI